MSDEKVDQDPVSVLSLAEKIYSDMIAEGEMRRAALIAEGDSYREEKIANSGEEVKRITERLESLREFEKAYRASLREFATNLLDSLKEPETEVEEIPEEISPSEAFLKAVEDAVEENEEPSQDSDSVDLFENQES